MPFLRAWRSVLAALWSACKSIDLEDCLKDFVYVAGYACIWYGGWLVAPACGYLLIGMLIVVPRLAGSIPERTDYRRGAPRPRPQSPQERSWAS